MDTVILSIFILLAASVLWNYVQIRQMQRRLTFLEKQHLALVAELEERLYPGG